MKAQSYLLGILVIILSLGAIWGAVFLAFSQYSTPSTPQPASPPNTPQFSEPAQTEATTSSATMSSTLPTLTTPIANAKIHSPLTLTGEAVGTWYFEASFPIILRDASGNVLAQTPAQAQGEWMSTSSVPFIAILTWATSTATSGVLILKKDNPSGLPEYDSEVVFPITF